jgi:hypothetical protein
MQDSRTDWRQVWLALGLFLVLLLPTTCPMARVPTQGTPFEFRPGLGNFPSMSGMNRNADPGALRSNQFHHLQNIRVVGDELVSRGGQTKITTAGALNGAIFAIFDDQNGEVTSNDWLLFTGQGTPRLYKHELSTGTTTLLAAGDLGGNAGPFPLYSTLHASQWYFGFTSIGGDTVARIYTLTASDIESGSVPTQVAQLSTGGTSYMSGALVSGPSSKLWWGVLGNAGGTKTAYVYSWDGASLALEDSVSVAGVTAGSPSVLIPDHDGNLLSFTSRGTGGPTVRFRTSGGSWSTKSLPVITNAELTSLIANDAAVFNGATYISCIFEDSATLAFRSVVLKWNGTALSVAYTPSATLGGTLVSLAIRSLYPFNSFLYYTFEEENGVGNKAALIGRTADGTAWTDNHKDMEAQVSTISAIGTLYATSDNLYCAVDGAFGGAFTQRVYQSPGTSTTGTWTAVATSLDSLFSVILPSGNGYRTITRLTS